MMSPKMGGCTSGMVSCGLGGRPLMICRDLRKTHCALRWSVHKMQLSAGASLIQAEDGPRLSAFLAEWDESRRKSSIRSAQVSNINTEIWNTVRQTARLTVASYEGSMSPTYAEKFPAYQWDDRHEGCQADRYMPYILQNIKVDSRHWQWVDVQGQRNLLTQVSMHTLGYNFKGTTDIILCSRNAVRSHIYTSGMRVLLEVKKAPVHDDSYQAMVILLLANSLNPKFKPVVVLTDLCDSWVFFGWKGNAYGTLLRTGQLPLES
ncbi:hypothetical protein ABBQ38_007140 [Trebouxia sp. C0009 RCD-2024]